MWEITLIGKYKDILFLQELINNLKKTYSNVFSAITYDKQVICSIAIKQDVEEEYLNATIMETILKICKCEYLEENLKIFGKDKSFNSFMLSMLMYMDLQDEVDFAIKITKFSRKVSIRSFVHFKLRKLISVWGRIVEYINLQFGESLQDIMYLDFLKFLASNAAAQTEIIFLEENNEKVLLLDKNKETLSIIPKEDEIGMIVNVIIHSPKKLVINCIDKISTKVANLLSYIFEDRISMLI